MTCLLGPRGADLTPGPANNTHIQNFTNTVSLDSSAGTREAFLNSFSPTLGFPLAGRVKSQWINETGMNTHTNEAFAVRLQKTQR